MTLLKDKFKRICEKSMIKKRYMHLTEEILKENPSIGVYKAPSLDVRQNMVIVEVPKLGKEAAIKAIQDWGQPKSKITHLVFCSSSGVDFPGADYQLTMLLGLHPSVKRIMINNQGCSAGGTGLRIAKDLAENNAAARVLLVCSENMTLSFHAPAEDDLDTLVGQALFADGAAALIVGANPDRSIECPLYQIVSAAQTIVPDSEGALVGRMREMGQTYHLSVNIPMLAANSIETSLVEAFGPLGISDWNSLFWIVHPGGPAILNRVEATFGLKEEKLRASRHVLREYGNMWSPSVFFVLGEMRKRSLEEKMSSTGEGLEWGVLVGMGPGMTVETVVLHSMPTGYGPNSLSHGP
ncbi:hypothetical protein L1049_022732 [Liquidambar formosana]|uniref:Chalcone synthase n=1 Tax=Liquidambar formosana TaxID=63359 RepID=A0AAP0RED4_LIQFO